MGTVALRGPAAEARKAFTLVELLVVMAIIAILAALLLPALGRAKLRSLASNCLGNSKQLQMSWLLYTHDFNDMIVPNGIASSNAWIDGSRGEFANNLPGATNLAIIRNGLLWNYNTSLGVYVCPDQRSVEVTSRRRTAPLRPARSFSISGQMNGGTPTGTTVVTPIFLTGNPTNAPAAKRVSEINRPIPSMAMVFADENLYSIDDGYFAVQVNTDVWQNFPAARHGNTGTFSFADGHSENHHWVAPGTALLKDPGGYTRTPRVNGQRNPDLQWCSDRYINPPN